MHFASRQWRTFELSVKLVPCPPSYSGVESSEVQPSRLIEPERDPCTGEGRAFDAVRPFCFGLGHAAPCHGNQSTQNGRPKTT